MPNVTLKSMDYIQQKDSRMYDFAKSVQDAINNLGQQTNASPAGAPEPPKPPAALAVTGKGGLFTATITDNGNVPNTAYLLHYSSSPQFTNPQTVDLGTAKTWQQNLGSQKLYFRAQSTHYTGAASAHTYCGSAAAPTAVVG
jgi:hypothetical protein